MLGTDTNHSQTHRSWLPDCICARKRRTLDSSIPAGFFVVVVKEMLCFN